MATALLGLGSNLGDRANTLWRALELLRADPQIRVEAVSSFRSSKPAGGPEGQGEFLNAAARLETSLSPEELLARLLAIEDQIGRVREERWGPRVMDLDLLLYDQVEFKTPTLELPHPRMCYRRFVLEPAAEVAGEMVWPVNGWSVATLRHNLDTSAKYVAISKSDILTLRDVLSRIEVEVECRILWEPAKERLPPRNHLRRLSREIECSSWRRESIWRISDFWYDQLSVQFECLLATHPAAANAIRLWETVRRNIVQPRLVIILEDPVHWWILANDTRPSSLATEFIFDIKPGHSAVHKEFYGQNPPRILPPCRLSAYSLAAVRGSGASRARGPSRHESDGVEKAVASPRVISTILAMQSAVRELQRAGKTVGLVPTMGALHEGHLSLVRRAKSECDMAVATIFVNPTQFAPHEDFSKYPRTLEADLQLLASANCDLMFVPTREEMYPPGVSTFIDPPSVAEPLEGVCRPGHFRGVATVVLKLFNAIPADKAFFGQKDFQQALVIQRMVADLNLPVQVVVCPIIREADGLALSSRNRYLSPSERPRGLALSRALNLVREKVSHGERDAILLKGQMHETLQTAGIERVDYATIADPRTLAEVTKIDGPAVALIAAFVGTTRLIDNCLLNVPDASPPPASLKDEPCARP